MAVGEVVGVEATEDQTNAFAVDWAVESVLECPVLVYVQLLKNLGNYG